VHLQGRGENILTQGRNFMLPAASRPQKTPPGLEWCSFLLPVTLQWMPPKGPSRPLSKECRMMACILRALHLPSPLLWMWTPSSYKWPCRGLSRLLGLYQAVQLEWGGNLSNGIAMVFWPRALSDLNNTRSLVTIRFSPPLVVYLKVDVVTVIEIAGLS
jgi:hypothetical protein